MMIKGLPKLSPADWNARWIWDKALDAQDDIMKQQVLYFRRSFAVDTPGTSLKVNVSADSRYRLYINGVSAAFGPCKGHAFEHYYETVDLTAYLKTGRNVIAVKVVHLPNAMPYLAGVGGPFSITRSTCGGFILEGAVVNPEGTELIRLDTDDSWKVLRDKAIATGRPTRAFWMGGPEIVHAESLPSGWELTDFDDSSWDSPVTIAWAHGSPNEAFHFGELPPWLLYPRPIPPMFEKDMSFTRVMTTDISGGQDLLDGSRCTVGPNQKGYIELDAGLLTTGFLRLSLEGGAGAKLRLMPSECYESDKDPRKTIRDDPSAGVLKGDADTYYPSGRCETYEPFWFRAFRFVRLDIETASEPLTLKGLSYREVGYPIEPKAAFQASDPDFGRFWDISKNTLRRCMHETYEDCPHYEQLQYTMDTRLQMLFTYSISNDDRMARKAINDFHCSRIPGGLLQSRYPSHLRQIIPSFSLHWIGMLFEHYWEYKDLDMIKRYRPTADGIIQWFADHIGSSGLFEGEDYWSFVDWVKEWTEHAGTPSSLIKGPDTITTLMFADALKQASYLNFVTGRKDVSEQYSDMSRSLLRAVKNLCWDEDEMLFADGPGLKQFSQHAQVWAVLSGALLTQTGARDLMNRCLDNDKLSKCSYSMSHFLFRALETAGIYSRAYELWETYRRLAGLNLTTWPEDPDNQRSDCHAWSATPLYEFTRMTLGVQGASPGYGRIVVAPQPGPLSWAKGTVPTPAGDVSVEWHRSPEDCGIADAPIDISVSGPAEVPVSITFPSGKSVDIKPGNSYKGQG